MLSCDVLVVGGGIAGIAAALAAARNGADTVLVEKQCVLGGLATSGLVTIYLPLCDGRGTQVSYGIAEELFHLSINYGIQDKNPAPWLVKDATKEERQKIRYEVQFNPVYFLLEAERLLLETGVRIFYDTQICGATVEGGVLKAVRLASESGMEELYCKASVDASGSAVLYRYCGEETCRHAVGNSAAGWYYASTKEGLKLKMLGFADLADGSERDGIAKGSGVRFAGDTRESVNAFLLKSHQGTLEDLRLRREKDEGFIEPALISTMPQLRMIRRIVGAGSMTEAEDGKPSASSIGMVSDWRKRGPKYEVPYEILYGQISNLFAAGRIVSCDDGMWDILRVIPCCSVTGEAAGTAAALTKAEGRRADLASVQAALASAGQRLHFTELEGYSE